MTRPLPPRLQAARGLWLILLPVVLVASVLAGCDEEFLDSEVPGTAVAGTTLRKASGDTQVGFVDSLLGQSLRVQVLDSRGQPLPNQRVEFRTSAGVLSATSGVTDFSGFTEVRFLPQQEGVVAVEARLPDGTSQTFLITAIDLAPFGRPGSFAKVGGDNQTGTIGTLLPEPLTVRVTSEGGTPLADFPVVFTAATDGTFLVTANEGDVTTRRDSTAVPEASQDLGTQVVSFTDANGIAAVLVRLRDRPGTNQVTASATFAENSPSVVTFTAQGTLGGPTSADSIVEISGDNQSVQVDTVGGRAATFSKTFNPMVVQVMDRFGNPIQGVRVFFRVSVGTGSLSNSEDVTDANGTAETTYTSEAGSSGDFQVSASAPGVGTVFFDGEILFVGTTPAPPDSGGTGGPGDSTSTGPITLTSISPVGQTAGGPGFELTALGENFTTSSVVHWNGSARSTIFDNSTRLRATILSSDVADVAQDSVTVITGSDTTSALIFTTS